MAQSLTGNPGMTGTLSIRYRKPTPLLTELVFEARVTKIEGPKILTHGTVSVDGLVTAEADGRFIAVGHVRFAKMAEANRRKLAEVEKRLGRRASSPYRLDGR
jgi:hypothetical protein